MRKKYEVRVVYESVVTYYVEADDVDAANRQAEAMFLDGKPDEEPSSGWSRISHYGTTLVSDE